MSVLALRPYQADAIERVRDSLRRGKRRPLIVAPTGSGKTVLATHLLQSVVDHGKHGLVVAHRRELIRQPFCKLLRNGIAPAEVGIIMAGTPARLVDAIAPPPHEIGDAEIWCYYARRRPRARLQIASIDTLRSKEAPPADIVVIDEAHRSLAKSYVAIAEKYPNAVIVGLTATPMRADGRGLDEFYDDMIIVAQYADLVAQGFLVEPRVWTVPADQLPDLAGVRVKGGDYDIEQLAERVDRRELIGDLVEHYVRHGGGAPALAFAVNIAHSKHIAESFNAAGVAAIHVDGTTPKHERDAAVAALESGRVKVVSNVDVWTEGTDIPIIKCVILARPTMSLRVYLQQVGRGSRPAGETPFVVLDHAGCAGQHGLPQVDREWSLRPPKKRRRPSDAPPSRTCPVCFAVLPVSARLCPECAYQFPAPEPKEIEQKDGQLVEVDRDRARALERAWTEIVELWRELNQRRESPYPPSWCERAMFRKHGCRRPPGAKLPAPMTFARMRAPEPPAPAIDALPDWAKPSVDAPTLPPGGILNSRAAEATEEPHITSLKPPPPEAVANTTPARVGEEAGTLFAKAG